jgi:hypothetical protein
LHDEQCGRREPLFVGIGKRTRCAFGFAFRVAFGSAFDFAGSARLGRGIRSGIA